MYCIVQQMYCTVHLTSDHESMSLSRGPPIFFYSSLKTKLDHDGTACTIWKCTAASTSESHALFGVACTFHENILYKVRFGPNNGTACAIQ